MSVINAINQMNEVNAIKRMLAEINQVTTLYFNIVVPYRDENSKVELLKLQYTESYLPIYVTYSVDGIDYTSGLGDKNVPMIVVTMLYYEVQKYYQHCLNMESVHIHCQ